jgi:hypothetical protein
MLNQTSEYMTILYCTISWYYASGIKLETGQRMKMLFICLERDQLSHTAEVLGVKEYAKGSERKGKAEDSDDRFDIIWIVPRP